MQLVGTQVSDGLPPQRKNTPLNDTTFRKLITFFSKGLEGILRGTFPKKVPLNYLSIKHFLPCRQRGHRASREQYICP